MTATLTPDEIVWGGGTKTQEPSDGVCAASRRQHRR